MNDFEYKGLKNVYIHNKEAAAQHPQYDEFIKRYNAEQKSNMDLQKQNKKFIN